MDGAPAESGYYFVQYMTTPLHALFNAPKTRAAVAMVRLEIFYSRRIISLGLDNQTPIVRWSERIPEPQL